MPKRTTIIDIAKKAGVSKSTVSLVLRNSPSVKEQTRKKVQQVIQSSDYVYHRGAAKMRSAQTGLVGLVINNLRNPFFTEFAVSAQMTFAEHGYATVMANSNEDFRLQQNIIYSLLEHGVDALMIAPCYGSDRKEFERISLMGIPALQVLRKADSRTELFPFCSFDYEQGSYRGATHLIEQGAKKIAFIGGIEGVQITNERESGYLGKMRELHKEPLCIYGATSREFGYKTAMRLAQSNKHIDAAIAFNDLVALGMLAGFAEAGIKPGKDFLLIGFDDIEESSQCYPRLSTVRCKVKEFSSYTANMLLDWMEKDVRPDGTYRMPVELVLRASA